MPPFTYDENFRAKEREVVETDSSFREELSYLINKHSKENGSNTPDFILANFLNNCLESFDIAVSHRDRLRSQNA